jgi:hypothetical protein
MLMEKAGYATFKVKDAVTKKEITINNSHFWPHFKKTNGFPTWFHLNMPIIYMIINNKDLIIQKFT